MRSFKYFRKWHVVCSSRANSRKASFNCSNFWYNHYRGVMKLASTLKPSVSSGYLGKKRSRFETFVKKLSDMFETQLEALRSFVTEIRGKQPDQILKLGMDSGGVFLKVPLGFLSLNQQPDSSPFKKVLSPIIAKLKRQLLVSLKISRKVMTMSSRSWISSSLENECSSLLMV